MSVVVRFPLGVRSAGAGERFIGVGSSQKHWTSGLYVVYDHFLGVVGYIVYEVLNEVS